MMRATRVGVACIVLLLALVALLLPLSANGERLQLTRGGRSVTREPLNAEEDAAADGAMHSEEKPVRNSAMAKVSKLRLRARAATEEQSALASGAAATLKAVAQLPSKVNRRGAGGRAGRAAGNGGQSGRRGGDAAGNGGQSGRRGGDSAGNGGQSGRRGGDAASNGGQSGRRGGDTSGNGGQSGRRGGDLPVSPITGSPAPDSNNVVWLMGVNRNWPVKVYLRNQGDAATCWAHSAVTLLELRQQMGYDKNRLKEWYSVDQIVKCVKHAGADGGSPLDAIEFLLSRQLQSDLQVRQGVPIECGKFDWSKLVTPKQGVNLERYQAILALKPCVNPGEDCRRMAEYEFEMERQFAQTPMLVYVDASQWHTYKPSFTPALAQTFELGLAADYTGVTFPSFMCSSDPMKGDHLVILLGTVTCARTKRKFWRVYNSWGKEWGVNGYIYLDYEQNACGLANYPVGLTEETVLSKGFSANSMLMVPKSMTRADAMKTPEYIKSGAGVTGGKEQWDQLVAAGKVKK